MEFFSPISGTHDLRNKNDVIDKNMTRDLFLGFMQKKR